MITLDALRSGIDLYRGQVSFALPLASLMGGGGPTFHLGARYNSNVARAVSTWNRQAPTGVLGLGWTLGFERISALYPNDAAAADEELILTTTDGAATRLIQTGQNLDGSIQYAAENYRFWKILRYTAIERWEITREDGVKYVYGDTRSRRQTVEYGVCWDNWIGSSATLTGQQTLAVGWDLSEIVDLWGNPLTFRYEQVTAAVGTSEGLPYTQAVYLAEVIGAASDRIVFNYLPKTSDEYQDPHTSPPPPNAWQDRFETRYLSSIDIFSPNEKMHTVAFDFTDSQGNTVFVGAGQMKKRLLMAVKTQFPDAPDSLPGVAFTYVTDGASSALGSIATVTTPAGGVATYSYSMATDLPLCDRVKTITPPQTALTYRLPRFWFDGNYAVVTWKASDNTAQVVAYTWEGRWLESILGVLPAPTDADYTNIQVTTDGANFGVVSGSHALAYHLDVTTPGAWVSSGVVNLSLNAGEATTIMSGDGFVSVLGLASGKLNRLRWSGTSWTPDTVTLSGGGSAGLKCGAACRHNLIFSASLPGNDPSAPLNLQLDYLDAQQQWQQVKFQKARPGATIIQIDVYAGDTYAVVDFQSQLIGQIQHNYQVYYWSANYDSLQSELLTQTVVSTPPLPPAIRGAFIGIGQELFRFDGHAWGRQSISSITYPGEQRVTAISYGYDQVLRSILKTDGSNLFDLIVYDPNRSGSSTPWSVKVGPVAPVGAGSFGASAARTNDQQSRYVIMPAVVDQNSSNGLYYQQPDGSWQIVQQITKSLAANELTSLQLLGELYCIYQMGTDTFIYPLQNGGIAAAGLIQLTGEQIIAPNNPPTMLVGQQAFITFTGTWGQPGSTLKLHRVVRQNVREKLTAVTVKTLHQDNGYQNVPDANGRLITSYDFTPGNATIDPTGYKPAFNLAKSAADTANISVTPQGVTAVSFFNNLALNEATVTPPYPVNTNATQFLRLLGGQMYFTQLTPDGSTTPVLSETNFWGVSTVEAGSTGQRAFYARVQKTGTTLDQVPDTVETVYDARTGLPKSVTTYSYNSSGTEDVFLTELVYWWEIYDPSRTQNLLTPVVQETQWANILTNNVKTSIAITTWTNNWGFTPKRWAPLASYVATTASPETFNKWNQTGGPLAAGWLLLSSVAERNSQGEIVRAVDAVNRCQSSGFDVTGLLEVASFANADTQSKEAGYYGFETYENNPDWSYTGGVSIRDFIISGQAHTGRRCLRFESDPTGTVGPISTWLHTASSRSFVFSCWMLVPTACNADGSNAYWSLQVEETGGGQSPIPVIKLPFPSTQAQKGKWSYIFQTVDLQALRQLHNIQPSAVLQVTIWGTNKSNSYCLVDELRFSPLDAIYIASVFDSSLRLKIAQLGENGATMRSVHDVYDREVALVGPSENVVNVNVPAFARMQSGNGAFDAALPNSQLRIIASDDGLYYDFDPSDTADWDLPANWSLSDFKLSFTGNSGVTVPPFGLPAKLKVKSLRNFAARVRFKPTGQIPYVGIGLDNLCVYWDVSEKAWIIGYQAGGNWVSAAIRRAPFGEDLVLCAVDDLILFYVNGSQIFAYQIPNFSPAGLLNMFLSGPGAFEQLVISINPQLSLLFTDGAGQPLQELYLVDNQTVVASGTLYDKLRRPQRQKNIVSRPASIVPVAYPQLAAPGENRVIGNIGTYLANQSNQSVSLQQYVQLDPPPFSETAYQNSPLARLTKIAAPGKAISGTAHVSTYSYARYTANGVMTGLGFDNAADQYALNTFTDPDGVKTYSLFNVNGQLLARRIELSEGRQAGDYSTMKYFYDGAGNLVKIQLPNYFVPPPNSQASVWEINRTFTYLNQIASETTPNDGTTQYKYDSVGRLQFIMDAAGAALTPQRILYIQYDNLNRPTEVGYVQSQNVSWGAIGQYTQYAWPAGVQPAWYRRFTYDADGTQSPNLIGQLWRVQTNSLPGSTPDMESYTYDQRGRVLSIKSAIARYDSSTYQSSFSYNNLDQLIEITYPQVLGSQGTSLGDPFKVGYFFDRLGRLVGVGEHPRGNEVFDPNNPITNPGNLYAGKYARYDYNNQGLLALAQFNNGGTGLPINRNYAYDISARLTQITGDYHNQTLTYESGGFGGAGYYNGQIASSETKYFSTRGTDRFFARPLSDYRWAYSYDKLGQLLNASCTEQVADLSFNLGVSHPMAYDANGNLRSIPRGPATETYDYKGSGTSQSNDQVQSVATTISVSEDFAGNHEGWMWGSSNAGPSGSGIVQSGVGTGKCLKLAGGSLGHEEQLELLCFLSVNGSYTLRYSFKADASFATQKGDAGWYLQFFTAGGDTVRVRVADLSAATTAWQSSGDISLNCRSYATGIGMNAHIIRIGLLLINAKRSNDGTPAASVYVTDIQLNGTSSPAPFTYDANGNVISSSARNITSLAYEPFSGLPAVANLSGVSIQSASYAYGQGGLRSSETIQYLTGQPDKTLYLRDPAGNVLMLRSMRGGTESVTFYLRGLDGLLATRTDGGEKYLLSDYLGSTCVVVSQTGNDQRPMPIFDYNPFGELFTAQNGVQLPYRYTGQEQDDALGIDNYNARLYDPSLRRFYGAETEQQFASPYVYVGNNPINYVDPTGHVAVRLPLMLLTAIAAGSTVMYVMYKGWNWYYAQYKRHVTEMEAQEVEKDWPIIGAHILSPMYALTLWRIEHETDAYKQNALRHCISHYQLNAFLGEDLTRRVGEAHEDVKPGTVYDDVSDRINNNVAKILAKGADSGVLLGIVTPFATGFLYRYIRRSFKAESAPIEADKPCIEAWHSGKLAYGWESHTTSPTRAEKAKICQSYKTSLAFLLQNNGFPTTFAARDWQLILSCVESNYDGIEPSRATSYELIKWIRSL